MAVAKTLFGSIRNRLLIGTTSLVVIPLVVLASVLGYASLRQAEQSLTQRAYDQMQSIREGKREEIRAYLQSSGDNLVVLAATGDVRSALRELPAAFAQLATEGAGDPAAVRQAVTAYWRDEFGAAYGERNGGTQVDISAAVAALDPEAVSAQFRYIADNANPLGKKGELDQAADGSSYSRLHALIHPVGRRAVQQYGLYDIFLFDMRGTVVYSYFKELDFATNMLTGPWKDSGLAESFVLSSSGKRPGDVSMTDYAPYRPSYDDQAVFLSAPVYDGETQIGVIALQLPIDRINQIMTFNGNWREVGLGDSGETYLIGPNKTPRSISRFMVQDPAAFVASLSGIESPERLAQMTTRASNIGAMSIDTQATREALAGQSGVAVFPDYRGIPVLGAYAPLDAYGRRFVLTSEIDAAESNAPVVTLRSQITLAALGTLAFMGLLGGLYALRLSASINAPLARLGEVVDKVAKGDRQVRARMNSGDEIGVLADAFDHMLDERNLVQERIEKENEDLNNSVIEIMTSVAELANRDLTVRVPVSENVTGAVSDAINMMSRSTAQALTHVRTISETVSRSSSEVRQRAERVSKVANTASDQATSAAAEIQQTAVALRQMGQAAGDANLQGEKALKSTADAMDLVRATVSGISSSRDQIRETEKRVKRLAERSQEITSIVNIIGQIAERTSVLALNASMQAVAAGDAGRGFAVVADEVKRLAENAREATQQIGGLVGAIQADTSETLHAMNGTIAQVVDISRLADRAGGQMDDTRGATEQLVAAVRGISTAAQAQNQASQTLLTRAYELLQGSQQTIDEIEAQRNEAEALGKSATELVSTVGQFKLPVGA